MEIRICGNNKIMLFRPKNLCLDHNPRSHLLAGPSRLEKQNRLSFRLPTPLELVGFHQIGERYTLLKQLTPQGLLYF